MRVQRRGPKLFREMILNTTRTCALTGIDDARLTASHIVAGKRTKRSVLPKTVICLTPCMTRLRSHLISCETTTASHRR